MYILYIYIMYILYILYFVYIYYMFIYFYHIYIIYYIFYIIYIYPGLYYFGFIPGCVFGNRVLVYVHFPGKSARCFWPRIR
jgi:hypothetical protein